MLIKMPILEPPPISPGSPVSPGPRGLPVIGESIENVRASTWQYLRHHPWYFTIPLVIVVAVEIVLVYIGPSALQFYLIPVVVPFIGYGIARNKIQHAFMEQFATANGFSYVQTGTLDGLDGALFQVGHSRSVSDVVTGTFQGHPISLFTYTYVTGYGKTEQVHKYTIYKLQFDIKLPAMLLENGSHVFGESLFAKLSGKESVRLEGDFSKYFSLSITKGYEVEALEIFTPDVMAELIDKAKLFSLEIVNGHLFIYDNKIVGTKQELYDLYNLAQYFVEKLGPVLARMKSSTETTEEYLSEKK